MKLLLSVLIVTLISLTSLAQTSPTYSLARPLGGGDLVLLETNLNTNTESVIASYADADFDDYDQNATSFAHSGGFCALVTGDNEDEVSYVVLNTNTGAIDYSGMFSGFELFTIEHYNGKLYSLGRPENGGNLVLLEKDLDSGSETIVQNYTADQIDDYDYEAVTFDYDMGVFIVLSYDADYFVRLMGFNVNTGNIDFSFTSLDYELFSTEYYDNKVYSLARPIDGGDLVLLSTNLITGSASEVDTYAESELSDYDQGSTSFDNANGRFVLLASDSDENPYLASINVSNGDIISFQSSTYELFSVETGGESSVGLGEELQTALSVYPNPAGGQIQISTPEIFSSIEIRNSSGKLVDVELGSRNFIDVSSLSPGKYWLIFNSNEGRRSVSFVKN